MSSWLRIAPTNVRSATEAEREAMQASDTDVVIVLGTDFDATVIESAAESDAEPAGF
jgi:hypothetical protein